MRLVIVSNRPEELAEFTEALRGQHGVELLAAENAPQALAMVRENGPTAAVIHALPGGDPLELVPDILRANALVHCVVASALSEDAFHEASEGLGVAARIPPHPKAADAAMVLDTLQRLGG